VGSHRSSLGSIPATPSVPFCFPADTLELFLEVLEVFIGEPFKINKLVSSAFNGTYDLVEFQINGFRVTVLRVLDEEYHEEGDDGRASIDNELPGVREVKCRAGQSPNANGNIANVKAHALPSKIDERRAKIRNESLTMQKKSRSSSCSLSFSLSLFISLIL
jgi:hypothetical protein